MIEELIALKGKGTLCVHEGQMRVKDAGINTPLFNSSAFEYLDSEDRKYPRYFNTPNQEVVANKIAALENAEKGMVFGSGMAAISTVVFGLLNSGDHVIALNNLYGGTLDFLKKDFERFDLEYSILPENNISAMEALKRANTKMLYLESPSNPLLEIVDLEEIAHWAKSNGILTCIDNTFASPVLQNPLDWGIDIVLHSATKYIGGHSDICAGAVCTREELMKPITQAAHNFGGSLNPMMAHLMERSLKTLEIRMERASHNAHCIAQFLHEHSSIDQVYYPGLPSFKGHDIAKKQMSAFGAMLSFEINGDPIHFQKRLELICPVMSLGGVETTICSPALTSHRLLTKEKRLDFGIRDNLLRLSVGIENTEDLINDIEQALDFSK
ncbi:MAG: PLP-dependent aspartate aminotransferase family protein [Bacteroidota bacterium]